MPMSENERGRQVTYNMVHGMTVFFAGAKTGALEVRIEEDGY